MQLERERTGASSPPRGDKSINNNYYYLITNYKFLLGNNATFLPAGEFR